MACSELGEGGLSLLTRRRLVPAISRPPGLQHMGRASHNECSLRLSMPATTACRFLCFLRAPVFFAAFGALAPISGCATYPAGGYGGLGYAWPDYGPGYAYSPGFGYSDFGAIGLGFDREHHFHHFDHDFDRRHFHHDFDRRFRADHLFHGQAMISEPGHPDVFHHPPWGFGGPEPRPGVRSGGGFHARAAGPPPVPHPGGARPTFNR